MTCDYLLSAEEAQCVNHFDAPLSIGVFAFARMGNSRRLALTVPLANMLFVCNSFNSFTDTQISHFDRGKVAV